MYLQLYLNHIMNKTLSNNKFMYSQLHLHHVTNKPIMFPISMKSANIYVLFLWVITVQKFSVFLHTSFSQGTAFACKDLLQIAPHVHYFVNHEIRTQISDHLTVQQYKMFCENTCFSHYMRIRNCADQGQIHRYCMSLELECSTRQTFVIRVNGTILKFTLRTSISRLNCVGAIDDFKFDTEEPNRLILQYFGG